MDAENEGAAHGALGIDHVWRKKLKAALDETRRVPLDDALRVFTAHFPEIDAEDLRAAVDGQREEWRVLLYSPEGGFNLPKSYKLDWAIAIYVYTLANPAVFRVVNREMYNPERRKPGGLGGGISDGLRACLPFVRVLLDALEALPERYVFSGEVRRGVKYVYPSSPARHDPVGHFRVGRRMMWYEFKSTSECQEVMTRDHFCGVAAGPRTIFIIQVLLAYAISAFSFFQGTDSEFEVLLPPLCEFEVVLATRNIIDATETVSVQRSGFPDTVHLRQVAPAGAQQQAGQEQQAQQEQQEQADAVLARALQQALDLEDNKAPHAQGASAATDTIQSEFKGNCANCGHGVWGHQTRGRDGNGRYVHMDAKDCARAPAAGQHSVPSGAAAGPGPAGPPPSAGAAPVHANLEGLLARLAALVAAEDWRAGAALEAEGLAAAAALQTTLKIERGSGGSVGLRFRRPKGSATGPFEIIAVDPHGPAELSGLETGDYICAVDGVDISALSREEVAALFGRKPGAPLELTLSVRARGAPGSIAGVLNNLGRCHAMMGQYAQARPLYEQARAAAAAAGDTVGVGKACNNLGVCHDEMGQYAQALPLYEQARAAAAAAGDIVWVRKACFNLGLCHHDMGQYAQARPLFEQARAAAAAAGDTKEVGRACNGLGVCHYDRGQYAQALPLFEQARAAFAAAGDTKVGNVCYNLGVCHAEMGQHAQALPLYEQARAAAAAAGDTAGVGKACYGVGVCHERMGQYAQALPLYEQARAASAAAGDTKGVGRACYGVGLCHERMGQHAQALPLYEQARAAYAAAGDTKEVGKACYGVGVCHVEMGQRARALPLYEQARAAFAAAGDTKLVGKACEGLGASHGNMGQYARALPLYEQARAAYAAAGDSAGAARVSGYLADCAARAGRR